MANSEGFLIYSPRRQATTGCLRLVNVQPLFHTHPPLQPERLEPGGSNLVWTHLARMLEDSSRQILIHSLKAEILKKNKEKLEKFQSCEMSLRQGFYLYILAPV